MNAAEYYRREMISTVIRYARGFWDETKHPRGQPENAGEFGAGKSGEESIAQESPRGWGASPAQPAAAEYKASAATPEAIQAAREKINSVALQDVDDAAIRSGLETIAEFGPGLLDGLKGVKGGKFPPNLKANAIADTKEGNIWLPDGKTPESLSTMVHELTHLRQKAEGRIPEGGREAMDPDSYNAIEVEAITAGVKFNLWLQNRGVS